MALVHVPPPPNPSEGRLYARPTPHVSPGPTGLFALGLSERRDGWLYVPNTLDRTRPAPLLVFLHGAGASADAMVRLLEPFAEARGLPMLAPDSRSSTWDVIVGGFGPDVAFLDRALARTFSEYPFDPSRVAIGGFSDGASYALSLGLTNGELFHDIVAFSPGFAAPGDVEGEPRIFVAHGTHDRVLPIDRCSRLLVRSLRASGYDVTFEEFDGGHVVPEEIADDALDWFIGTKRAN